MRQVTGDQPGLAGPDQPAGNAATEPAEPGPAGQGQRPGDAATKPAAPGPPCGAAVFLPAWGRGSPAARLLLALVAALVLVAAGGGVGAAIALRYAGNGTMVTGSAPPSGQGTATAPAQQLAQAAAAALPSVVTITVTTPRSTDEGSGVILRSDGTVITNNHVIEAAAGGAAEIRVTFAGGQSARATIVGQDPAADIAVIRASGVSGATPARLGTPSGLHVGDTVLAVGSPLGLSGTVTSGIVSALHRTITTGDGNSPYESVPALAQQATAGVLRDVIQTDAAINPGNSGGALVDDTGRVVGITTAIATVGGASGQKSGNVGVGFAIPISTAYDVAMQLISQ